MPGYKRKNDTTVKTRKEEFVVEHDEQPQRARVDKIPTLRPAFAENGTITAANASSISDGASAMVLMAEAEAESRGMKPMARIVGYARHSQASEQFTMTPIGSITKLFEKTGWDKDSTNLFEINEAFAMVPMLITRQLELDSEKVNIHGGAFALGHPLGSTSSRISISLMYALKRYGKKRGIATMCIGGGESLAMALEMI